MTLFAVLLLMVLPFAGLVRFAGARPWRPGVRFVVLAAIVGGIPALCWSFALNSLGSGAFFGLIALIVSFAGLFGAVMGWIWLSLSRKA
jgi:drug/metabolite transporter (DMT)-like permease